MKKLINNLLYAGLILTALNFTSCQDEFEEVGGTDDQETIQANSSVAKLIKETSSHDGSYDNIVDGASCFAVQFPYTVEVNGIEITLDSEEDLQAIEDIFDEVDGDDDILEIFFPITITLSDFSEIVIENKEQLITKVEACFEGDDDDDIECIDFVYPITLFTFDVNFQQSGQVNIESDEQMRRFFGELDENDIVSIEFPITLKKYDGTEIIIENNASLDMALGYAKDECDEDDDNDHNDDDFTKERLDAYLVECPWEVREMYRENVNQTDQYLEYLMVFNEDGSVTVNDRIGNTLNGTWSTSATDAGVLVNLDFDVLVDFNIEWLAYELDDNKIKFYNDNGNKIILKQRCDVTPGEEPDPTILREILAECEWIIKKVKNQGEEIDRLLGYEFTFMAEGAVLLSNGVNTSEGTWEIGLNSQMVLSLMINIGDEPGVSFEWPVRELTDTRLKFEIDETDYELILLRVCDDSADDGDVTEIRNIMMDGPWNVALYSEGEMDMTSEFTGLDFSFSTMHQVEVSELGNVTAEGLWRILRDSEEGLKFYLNFDSAGSLGELTEDWKIMSITATRIELKDESGDGTLETLVFEKP